MPPSFRGSVSCGGEGSCQGVSPGPAAIAATRPISVSFPTVSAPSKATAADSSGTARGEGTVGAGGGARVGSVGGGAGGGGVSPVGRVGGGSAGGVGGGSPVGDAGAGSGAVG